MRGCRRGGDLSESYERCQCDADIRRPMFCHLTPVTTLPGCVCQQSSVMRMEWGRGTET